jgi:hypothetical protein
VVEGASLENWSTGNRTGGSNPSLSAKFRVVRFTNLTQNALNPLNPIPTSILVRSRNEF